MRIGARVRSLAWLVALTLVVSLAATSPASTATFTRSNGYWIAAGSGDVYAFGDAPTLGPVSRRGPQYVDLATTATGKGYWLATSAGLVSAVGDAAAFGSLVDEVRGGGQIVAIASRPQGDGYWLLASDGEVFQAGAAATFTALERRAKPYVDLVATPRGNGYWAVDAEGNVSARGDASFVAPAPHTTKVVAIAATPTGAGYWLLDAQAGVWAFGDAQALPAVSATGPFVDFAVTHSGNGYWLLDSHGNVVPVGDAVQYGALGRPALRGTPAVAIAVTPFVNHPPITTDDATSLDEDTSVDVAVLANDTDAESDPLSARILVQPAHGTATVLASGVIRYQPAANYHGADDLVYEADDGSGGRTPGTLRIEVRPVNDAPVAVDDDLATDEDTALVMAAPGVVVNDSDVDGDTLVATVVAGPAHGTVLIAADGSLRYTPAPNYNGPDSFTYRADDGAGGTDEGLVTITVRAVPDAPIALPDSYIVSEDATLTSTAPGVLGNDSDADGDLINASLVTQAQHGTATLSPTGAFSYVPEPNFNGTDTFTYSVSDGTLTSATAVTVVVTPVNDLPIAAADTGSTQEDVPLTVAAPGVLGNDSDLDGDTLTAIIAGAPGHGTVTLASNGSYVYTPHADFNGGDSFSYRAADATEQSAPVTVTITISAVNDEPVALNDTFTATVASGGSLSVAAPGVLVNDSDADGDPLTAALVAGPASGTLSLNADGSFSFAPASSGVVTFTYRAQDGTLFSQATVTLNITIGTGGGGGGSGFGFGTPTPELFDFESYNGHPATPGHIGREFLGGTEVEVLSPDWLR